MPLTSGWMKHIRNVLLNATLMTRVIHCSSKEEAEQMLEELKTRMQEFELTLHPEKTKIVYYKNYQRTEKHDRKSFTFLSYSFQPRTVKDKFGRAKHLSL